MNQIIYPTKVSRSIFSGFALSGRIFVLTAFLAVMALQAEAQQVVTISVITSSDDAEQQGAAGTSPGAVNLSSTDLEMVNDLQTPTAGAQTIGLRFQGITIPQGAIISSAYITFTAVAADYTMTNSEATSLTIKGQSADNAATFTTAVNNISDRATTTASTSWAPDAWVTGSKYNTPVVTDIVQELVNRAGWASGNSMAFIITGTGHRSAASYDDISSGNEPKLVINYTL
jgi:hypothetical protein